MWRTCEATEQRPHVMHVVGDYKYLRSALALHFRNPSAGDTNPLSLHFLISGFENSSPNPQPSFSASSSLQIIANFIKRPACTEHPKSFDLLSALESQIPSALSTSEFCMTHLRASPPQISFTVPMPEPRTEKKVKQKTDWGDGKPQIRRTKVWWNSRRYHIGEGKR